MNQTKELELLRAVFDSQVREHSLPWRVERSWSFDVVASDDAVIAQCPAQEEADAVVEYATKRQADNQKAA